MGTTLFIVAVIVGLLLWKRPKDDGKPHNDYFRSLESVYQSNGLSEPRLIIDGQRLDQNIDSLVQKIGSDRYRIVAKSLPSLPLLRHVMARANTRKLMVFHRPFLSVIVREIPDADILLGKPMPIAAVKRFYKNLTPEQIHSANRQIQWLVDGLEHLEEYRALAQSLNVTLRINLEIDIGLHRGGFKQGGSDYPEALRYIHSHTEYLALSGLMGYEPHIAKMPLASAERMNKAKSKATAQYQWFKDYIKLNYSDTYRTNLTFNGAGSPTCQLYQSDDTINDISAGSSLLMPTDFDLLSIRDQKPALFIATPVIKALGALELPFLEPICSLLARYNPNWQRSYFIYGGYWKATPCSPQGLSNNGLYGRSSNQELLTGSGSSQLKINDVVFLRPSQSEAVLLEFGEILVVRNNEIAEQWPHLAQSCIENGIQ
ncbi:alanine racemase domain protein [gamma proteobacterium HTCC5015]|nr:alanine racemase domain protein [gamma proteobacterium HTCC5015]